LVSQANKDGIFEGWDYGDLWLPDQPDIRPGNTVSVESLGLTAAVNPVGTINGAADVWENTVVGTVLAPWFSQDLELQCNVWEDGGPSIIETVNPKGGSYECYFDDVGWDLESGHQVAVYYYEPDGDAVIHVFSQHLLRLPLVLK